MPNDNTVSRLPEWVERVKTGAGWMTSLAPPAAAFGRDAQGLVVIAAQMADLLPRHFAVFGTQRSASARETA